MQLDINNIHMCVAMEDAKAVFNKSYFDETWSERDLDGKNVLMCSRMISTYVNALANAGFVIERMDQKITSGAADGYI